MADSASNLQCPGFEYDSYALDMVGDGYEKVSSYELKLVLYCTYPDVLVSDKFYIFKLKSYLLCLQCGLSFLKIMVNFYRILHNLYNNLYSFVQ